MQVDWLTAIDDAGALVGKGKLQNGFDVAIIAEPGSACATLVEAVRLR